MDFNRVTKIVLTKGADTITVTQGIEAGSISISEILFDGSLEFGAINSNKLELRLYSTVDIKGYKIQLLQGSSFVKDSQGNDTQELTDEQKMFTGYVQSCKLSGYDYYRDIIAYDELYFKKDLNIANFYSGTVEHDIQDAYSYEGFFNDETTTKTLKGFREALCRKFLGFTLVDALDLPNDDMTVEKTVSISSMKFSEMIKMVCELQGTIPNMTRDGKLEFVRLSTNNPKELIGSGANSVIETENSTFEDFTTDVVTQVIFMGEDSEGNQQMVGWSDSANPNNNIFQIENNIFIRGKQETDVKNYANAIYKGIINGVETSGIKDITYTPAEISMIVSDTSIKLGDIIKVKYEPDYTRDFEFQLNQPSDWSTAYNTYYKVTEWEANDVPEFRANTFFYLYAPASRPNVRSYRVLPNEPTDWDRNYTSYYKISKMSLNNSSSWVNNNTSTDGMYNNSANTYIFKATKALERIVYCTGIELSGSQLVNETIICSGEESLSDSTSSSNPEFEALADKAYPIQTSMSVDYFRAKYISTDYIQAKSANFGEAIINNLVAGTITTEEINAIRAKIDTLDANTIASTWLTATYASLQVLTANTITSDVISTKYLTADMANLGQVGMETFFAKTGIITDVTVVNQHITGRLTGVKINADVIDTGTLAVKRLIIKGSPTETYELLTSKPRGWEAEYTKYFVKSGNDYVVNTNPDWNTNTYYQQKYNHTNALMYALNDGVLGSTLLTEEQLNTQLNGRIIVAESITADQIRANAITANKIHSNAIESRHIVAGEIKSVHIESGAITADKIKAGSITSECLAVGDFTNYFIVNPTNLNEFKWKTSPSSFTEIGWITPTDNASYYVLTEVLQLPAGTRLQLFGYMYTYAYDTGIIIRWIRADGTVSSYEYASSGVRGESSIHYNTEATIEFNNTNKNNLIKIPNYPTDAVSFQIAMYTKKSDMYKFHLRNFAIRRADGGDIIAGKIMSRDGNSYFNLDSGMIRTNNARITGGTIQIGELSDGAYTEIAKGIISLYAQKTGYATTKAFSIVPVYNSNLSEISAGFILSPSASHFSFSKQTSDSSSTVNEVFEITSNGTILANLQNTNTIYVLQHRRRNKGYLNIGIGSPSGDGVSSILLNLTGDSSAANTICAIHTYRTRYNANGCIVQFDNGSNGYNGYETKRAYIHINNESIVLKSTQENTSNPPSTNSGMLNLFAGYINSSVVAVSSTEDIKTNITPSISVLQSVFENSEIYSYNLTHKEPVVTQDGQEVFELDENDEIVLDGNGDPVPQMQTVADNETSYGFVIGSNYNTPQEVISEDGAHINLYSMASLTWKAVQELYERVKLLEGNTAQSV